MRFSILILLYLPIAMMAQLPEVNTGKLERLEMSSKYIGERNVDVWLPDGYTEDKEYAVLYMHDGQMLYDSNTTWNGQEWGVDEVLGSMMRGGAIRDCIVVGVWNNSEKRHFEYFPEKAFNYCSKEDMQMLNGDTTISRIFSLDSLLADDYLKFLVKELRPLINKKYSVKTDRASTYIAGSSMGGLISMYAICEYPDIFGGAACLSTHWVGIFRMNDNPIPAALMAYLRDHLPDPSTHKLYFDHGTETLDAMYSMYQLQANEILKEKGYNSGNSLSLVFEGADHSEIAWNERLHIPVTFLLGKN